MNHGCWGKTPMSNPARHNLLVLAATFATSLLNYGFAVALSWFFEPAQFGVLGVAQSLLMLFALLAGSGFSWTAAQRVAVDIKRGGLTEAGRREVRAAWLANVFLALALGALTWVAYLAGWFPLGAAYTFIIPLTIATTLLLAARSVTNGVLRGSLRFGALAVNLVGEVLVKAVLGLILAAMGWGAMGVMAGFVLGALASLLHSLWAVSGERLWHGGGWWDGQVVRRTFPIFAGALSVAFMLNLDVLGLKLLSPPGSSDELAGFYQAAVLLARTPVFLAQALALVLFSYASADVDHKKTATALHAGAALRSWVRFLLPIALAFMAAPHTALQLFFPASYSASGDILRWVAAGGALLALTTLLNSLLQAIGENRAAAISSSLGALVQISVLVYGVPRWGAPGAALSLVAASLAALVGMFHALRLLLTSGTARFTFSMPANRVKSFLSAISPHAALVGVLMFFPDSTPLAGLGKFALAAVVYLAVLAITLRRSHPRNDQPSGLLAQLAQAMLGG